MTGCVAELFFWTLGNNVYIPDHVTGCHVYHDKDEKVSKSEHPYLEEKQLYADSRDLTWTPRNKRPEKLRDTLKEAELLLTQYRCVKATWKTKVILRIVLSNGYLITYLVKNNVADIEKVLIDKSLNGKLSGQIISDALFTNEFLILSYHNIAKIDYIYFQKKSTTDATKKIEKITSLYPKICHFDIPGPATRRVNRYLSYCSDSSLILVWWSMTSSDGCPWSPLVSDREQANLVLLTVDGPRLEIVSYAKTEYNLLNATFSRCQTRQIITVELVASRSGEATVEVGTYEILSAKLHRSGSVSIPLPSPFTSHCVHPTENRILLGCMDGTLVMFDEISMTMYSTQANLVPTCMTWHSNGTVVFVANSCGNIQLFDLALNHLNFQLLGDSFSSETVLKTEMFFRSTVLLQDMQWNNPLNKVEASSNPHFLLLIFNRGLLAVLQLYLGLISQEGLSVLELIKEYIKHRQLHQATSLLCSLHWDIDGPSCYASLSAIVNHLLRMPLNAEREGYLEKALSMFYSPKETLSVATILEYRDPICRLARRFFHLLLRYSRFDKAFLLAVDIGSEDLFMDIHYKALDHKETALAEVSKRKAEEIRDSYVNSSEEESESQESLGSDLYHSDNYSVLHGSANTGYVQNVPHYKKLRKNSSIHQQYPSQQPKITSQHHHIGNYGGEPGAEASYCEPAPFHVTTCDQPELYSDEIGKELANELIEDYTAALMDDPTNDGDGVSHVFTYL